MLVPAPISDFSEPDLALRRVRDLRLAQDAPLDDEVGEVLP